MDERELGRTGLMVSKLGFGCGAVGGLMVRGDPAEQTRAVTRALEAGITYFDTAPAYGDGRSEESLGRVLSELNAWGRVVVGTKVRYAPEPGESAADMIRRSTEVSLRRLGRDSVDLMQLHNHIASVSGPENGVPLEEVLGPIAEALVGLVDDGLARHVGFTGLGDPAAVRAILEDGRFETVQAYFNLLNPSAGFSGASGGRQDLEGLIDEAAANDVGVIVIRPYAAGAISGQPERHPNAGDPGGSLAGTATYESDLARAQGLAALADELGAESLLEVAMRFALSKEGVSTVIAGYSNFEHLESAIRWAERGPLPNSAIDRIVASAR